MRTEKEIRDKLELKLAELKCIRTDYNRYIGTLYEDKYIPDILDAWAKVEGQINVLQWVLEN